MEVLPRGCIIWCKGGVLTQFNVIGEKLFSTVLGVNCQNTEVRINEHFHVSNSNLTNLVVYFESKITIRVYKNVSFLHLKIYNLEMIIAIKFQNKIAGSILFLRFFSESVF